MPHGRHPNTWGLRWRQEPPKYLALKNSGASIQETQMAVGNRDTTIKGLVHRVTCFRAQCQSSSLKSAFTVSKRDPFANLKEPAGILPDRGSFFHSSIFPSQAHTRSPCTPLLLWYRLAGSTRLPVKKSYLLSLEQLDGAKKY